MEDRKRTLPDIGTSCEKSIALYYFLLLLLISFRKEIMRRKENLKDADEACTKMEIADKFLKEQTEPQYSTKLFTDAGRIRQVWIF